MDRKYFFDQIRTELFAGQLSISQVKGMTFILDTIAQQNFTDKRFIAYMLATVFHETGRTMLPIQEYGRGKGYDYGKKLKRSRLSYTTPDQLYYGRGYVQLTWFENYQQQGKILGLDLLNNPSLALDPIIAAKIMINGMIRGDFTGKSLKMYFTDQSSDPIGARKIINGTDCATLIAGHYHKFLKAIN